MAVPCVSRGWHRARGVRGRLRDRAGAGAGRSAAARAGAHDGPAAVAGGACQLLDYDVVDKTIGIRFDIAGAGDQANDT